MKKTRRVGNQSSGVPFSLLSGSRMTAPDVVASLSKPPPAGAATAHHPEPWESWGIAARWNPQHLWHAPDENQ